MTIRAVPHRPEDDAAWDAFVAASRNGTVFQTRRFLSYHPAGKFADHSLRFLDGETCAGVLTAAAVEENGRKLLVSHPGSSYGGLVLSPARGMKDTGAMLEALEAHAAAEGFAGIRFLRLTPPGVRKAASDDQEYWLYRRGWRVSRFELATTLPLSGLTEESLLAGYDGKCRNAVRQGQRSGLAVRLSEDLDAYWPILEATLAGRHGTKPTHTLEDFRRLRAACPGEFRLLGAYDGDRLVAGIVFAAVHERALYTVYIAQDFAEQGKRPLPLLVHALACLGIREGRDVLDFGISTEDGGKTANEGLFFFKESFGGASVRRESWERVP